MRIRTALVAVLAVAAVATVPAEAATKKKPVVKLCNLLTDVSGDGEWSIVDTKGLDVLSGDIATGPKEMVAVLRVGTTELTDDPYVALGYEFKLGADAMGARYVFRVTRSSRGGTRITPSASIAGTEVPVAAFKIVDSTYVWTIKRSDAPGMARPKLVWSNLGATTHVFGNGADGATSAKKYPDRAASCVIAK